MGTTLKPAPDKLEVTLLIDGDVIAFIAAAAVQHVHEDSFGQVQPFALRHEGEAVVDNLLAGLQITFKATHSKVVLSDPEDNFRSRIWPGYKGNRATTFYVDGKRVSLEHKPLLLSRLKDYLRTKYGAFHWPSLEADDVLGILNTEPQAYPGKRILIGRDKDFRTVPGLYHHLTRFDYRTKPEVEEITEWQAQRFHIMQTLMGDMTDGYPGCPGLGSKRTEKLMKSPVMLRRTDGVKTRGVNKGQSTDRWLAEPTSDLWAMVVTHYQKAGATEEDALVTARLAYILHHEDYNRETEEITLWVPSRLKSA